jgi:phosphoenolpyruvate-protein phosphotransferase (PTS system enzyme I)
MQHLTGLGVSPGVATGRALVLRQQTRDIRYRVPADASTAERTRLDLARDRSRTQLRDIRERVARTAGAEYAALFDAQLLMLDDPMLVGRANACILEDGLNAEWAIERAAGELSHLLETDDPYLRERRGDLDDVVGRLRMNLGYARSNGVRDLLRAVPGRCVLVADALPPSVAAQLDWTRVTGFASDAGTRTYHTAILARSLGVPAVVGLHDASRRIAPGALVVLDGSTGDVLVDPTDDVASDLAARQAARTLVATELSELRDLPAVTADGTPVALLGNLELPGDVSTALAHGAEGIGLYRSEFLLASQPSEALTEDAQVDVYRTLLAEMAPREVTIRTFDATEAQLGLRLSPATGALTPRLGLRAIRLSLAFRDLFRTQLRALLRAAPHGRLRIMFPLVSSADELREARQVLDDAAADLRALGEPPPDVPVGAMIEVPSAALTADLLAPYADFFSIGTNDLIQYTLAADRTDDRMQHFYEPLHPAILRMVRQVQRAGRHYRRRVAVCGEMASDPLLITVLLGLGVTEFSMTPGAIPAAKQVVRGVDLGDARRMARWALGAVTIEGVRARLQGSP